MIMLAVLWRQRGLKHCGYYYTGDIDGIVGALTRRAYVRFQRDKGLTVDGLYGTQTDTALINHVKNVQRLLNQHGANLVVDGLCGELTILAIKNFQRSKGLVVDGIAGVKTMAALNGTPDLKPKPEPTPAPTPTGKNARPIVINAGHGGKDPGAVANGLQEKDLNLRVAQHLYADLTGRGYKCLMTRTDDRHMYLSARVDIAKRNNACVYVSIHHNAGGGKGAEVLCHQRASQASVKLANLMLEEYKNIGQGSRGVKFMNRYEVRETPMPAVISEFAFLDNNADVQMVNSDEKLRKEAYAIANAIQRWL